MAENYNISLTFDMELPEYERQKAKEYSLQVDIFMRRI